MVTTRQAGDGAASAMEPPGAVAGAGVAPAPPRTLLEEVNAHLVCALCHGYYIDATTIVECLHSFCRSCIVKHLRAKSYCPVCEMMINAARPNIKPDKALQDIVYKLVPGLFQSEMQRRQEFYSSRPGPAASATPEQRGEDTERIIFSPEDVISFSLEYMDRSEADGASSRSSESGNESTPCNEGGAPTRRYLQCPAVVNISHLKKFLSMKYDIDATHFFVDILYKRVPLPDYYTLMDIAYIYNWKRNEPMRFFYQITDFGAIRDRFGFFGINRPGALLLRRKPGLGGAGGPGGPGSPGSPALALTEASSDGSSGSYSPVPEHLDERSKNITDFCEDSEKSKTSLSAGSEVPPPEDGLIADSQTSSPSSSSMDAEKSEFLNSFELTAKNSVGPGKCSNSPVKEEPQKSEDLKWISPDKSKSTPPKSNAKIEISPSKRKSALVPDDANDGKKPKLDKSLNESDLLKSSVKLDVIHSDPVSIVASVAASVAPSAASSVCPPPLVSCPKVLPPQSVSSPGKNIPSSGSKAVTSVASPASFSTVTQTEQKITIPPAKGTVMSDGNIETKKFGPLPVKSCSLKRKLPDDLSSQVQHVPKTFNVPKPEILKTLPTVPIMKVPDPKQQRPALKTDLRGGPRPRFPPPKTCLPVNTLPDDKSKKPPEEKKELVKTPNLTSPRVAGTLRMQSLKPPKSRGDTLKSLFDSCNINIPSSLSITLTDQKLDASQNESSDNNGDKKQMPNAGTTNSQSSQSTFQSNTPSPPVHNYIEILKIPDADPVKKCIESDKNKSSQPSKSTEASGKGPVPNLKPISDAKQPKSGSFTKPQTFQQTFLQSLQQQSDKPKYIKTRIDFPKPSPEEVEEPSSPVLPSNLIRIKPKPPVPATQPLKKLTPILPKTVKPESALDLSTPHTVHSQFGPQQTKALETMQSIANLAKRQSFTQRMTSPSQAFSQESFKMNTSSTSVSGNPTPLRIPVLPPHNKHLKTNNSPQNAKGSSPKYFPDYFQSQKTANARSNNGNPSQISKPLGSQQPAVPFTQPPRAPTRSPSSSPKLVIACPSPKSYSPEEKQLLSPRTVDNGSQSNLISSSQISSTNHASSEASGSKDPPRAAKTLKPQSINKPSNVRSSAVPHRPGAGAGPGPGPGLAAAGVVGSGSSAASDAQRMYLRHQLDLQTQLGLLPRGAAEQWINNPVARAQFENILKMSQSQPFSAFNNHNLKDK